MAILGFRTFSFSEVCDKLSWIVVVVLRVFGGKMINPLVGPGSDLKFNF